MQELLWDKTLSWNSWFRDDVTLPRLKAAGYTVVGLTIGGGNGGRAAAALGLQAIQRTLQEHPHDYRLVRSIEDVHLAQRMGQLAVELNFQGGEPLEGRLEAVEEFHRLGVRQIGLVWNADNDLGCSSTTTVDSGLTALGRAFIGEMNRLGVLVDATHASHRTSMDAMEMSRVPVVFSHSNVDSIAASYKNLKDDQIRHCADRGGVVGISGFGTYLDDLAAPAQSIFRQIDYVCELVGPRHVGLGLDFVRDAEPLWRKVRAHPSLWPGVRESTFFPPEGVPSVRGLMHDAGYSEGDIADILGGNWLRVCTEVWGGCPATGAMHG